MTLDEARDRRAALLVEVDRLRRSRDPALHGKEVELARLKSWIKERSAGRQAASDWSLLFHARRYLKTQEATGADIGGDGRKLIVAIEEHLPDWYIRQHEEQQEGQEPDQDG